MLQSSTFSCFLQVIWVKMRYTVTKIAAEFYSSSGTRYIYIPKEIQKIEPNCKHAFIRKKEAISKNKKKVGVEHTTKEEVLQATIEVIDKYLNKK